MREARPKPVEAPITKTFFGPPVMGPRRTTVSICSCTWAAQPSGWEVMQTKPRVFGRMIIVESGEVPPREPAGKSQNYPGRQVFFWQSRNISGSGGAYGMTGGWSAAVLRVRQSLAERRLPSDQPHSQRAQDQQYGEDDEDLLFLFGNGKGHR